MERKIEFTREDYDFFNHYIQNQNEDCLDNEVFALTQGAVQAELILIKDAWDYDNTNLSEEERWREFYKIDLSTFILGKDTGYGEKLDKNGNEIPYALGIGSYIEWKDTYEETVDEIEREFDKILSNHEDMQEAANRTDLTWDMVN